MTEETHNSEQDKSSLFDVQLDPVAQQHIAAIIQWSRIVAFLILALLGIMVLALMATSNKDITSGSFIPGMSAGESWSALILSSIVMVVIIGIWMFFLIRGAKLLRDGLATNDSTALASGFRFLRIFFTFSVVLGVLSTISSLLNFF